MENTKISKKQLAINVYIEFHKQGRKITLEKMVEKCGLTINGASTYYANCKNGLWSVGEEVQSIPTITLEQLKEMSNKQLVDFYNEKSTEKLVKFRDKQSGIERICKLLNLQLV